MRFPCIKLSQYFLKPFRSFGENINIKIDLSNYTAKTDLTNTCWYFKFCTKTNLASLKTEVDKLDIDKLAPVPVDLSKLSDVVKNVFKKAVYEKLVAKVNNIGKCILARSKNTSTVITSDFVLKYVWFCFKKLNIKQTRQN